ncbi:MAG: hypothetical protein D3906_07640 [Candidatus Electrothrix sp. AUS1_2]|nr:hypothetical protein [Candidatus Electrothrix sp. AUS1_2]
MFSEIYHKLPSARALFSASISLYFFFIDDEHLCFTVGDVAGEGIPAALFMVITKKLISSIARLGFGKSLGEMMININEMLWKIPVLCSLPCLSVFSM